ncbi:MAG: hypothetical protein A2499_03070 [Stygiobacter sp. RIFOXYC12_FULL_38_8]|nr:MAG: hypothetical protein A2279_09015 [Stygiobacter sp. RIFOXYA12_FULL_38_9]OGV06643.1 MAG: hypothetical protein A2299_01505 [Stygiobacter sp. RIFOXYB2_FULL_37_11]OGV11507.1 MAG: hypothetical protein A2237_05485 [Stygiobacter sp. RIFOXYA2_FULL_38_8]OGV15027.1 MAG: hypothetical protein A2440_06670 [Stygiobacter sp. RIFOXYC2_FULL_38_25]OGV22093.1 MAG: hypothetical protein A2499_03070 [Stygiobacter sp. RIFOXYC12_FULL_38_8]OGV79601.1 MAG: hypothetical protein A2X65_18750 [Stygiobacter sp. GWF2_
MVSLCYKVGLSTDRSNELNKDQSPIVSFSIDSEPFRTVYWVCSNSASSVIQSTWIIPNEDSMTINNKMFYVDQYCNTICGCPFFICHIVFNRKGTV